MQTLEKISGGGFADLYRVSEKRVLKAYIRKAHANRPVTNWQDHDLITEAHFRSERNAYEVLQDREELEKHIPQYFGPADPIELLQNESAKDKYVKGCGILLEFIPGKDSKLVHLEAELRAEVEFVVDQFSEILKNVNVWDSSCFHPGTRAKFTVIDFALWESEKYESFLYDNSNLSAELREQLVRENAH